MWVTVLGEYPDLAIYDVVDELLDMIRPKDPPNITQVRLGQGLEDGAHKVITGRKEGKRQGGQPRPFLGAMQAPIAPRVSRQRYDVVVTTQRTAGCRSLIICCDVRAVVLQRTRAAGRTAAHPTVNAPKGHSLSFSKSCIPPPTDDPAH